MKEKFNICFIANGEKYIIECAVVIVSILMNSKDDENFSFHIISDTITNDEKDKLIQLKEIKDFDIHFYIPQTEKYKKWVEQSKGKVLKRWSYHVFLKLEIMNILKDLDRVLFLDTDMIVLKSLKDIFSLNLNDYYIAAAELKIDIINYLREDGCKFLHVKNTSEAKEEYTQKIYKNRKLEYEKMGILDKSPDQWINSGFMFLNLKALRDIMTEEAMDSHFIRLINSDVLMFGHEAFLNYFIPNEKILRVSESYNARMAMWRKEEYCDVHIAHFLGLTLLESVFTKTAPEYKNKLLLYSWKYLTYTPWYKENPFYYIDLFSMYNSIMFEYKINKIVDIIVWIIPFKKIRDKLRYKLKKIIEEASY